MSKIGKLFVFEGPDGVGKTTLSQGFVDYLRASGHDCDYYSFPGKESGTLGEHVYNLHHDLKAAKIESVVPASLQLLHVAAHLDIIESRILPSLNKGRLVVLDRFWWSTWVYGVVGGVDKRVLQAMVDLEQICWKGVNPARTFLISRRAMSPRDTVDGWPRLVKEYAKLAVRESEHYPVQRIKNLKDISHSLDEIVRAFEEAVPHARDPVPLAPNRTRYRMGFREMASARPLIFKKLEPAKPTKVFDTYWRFAAERQAIFFRRLCNHPHPWTDDPILRAFKFTNAYRASDRVSQYLIRHVIYEGDQSIDEVFFRTILFKIFNKIETWELLLRELGEISFADYSFDHYDAILNQAPRLYSAAYIMPSGTSRARIARKYQMHLKLVEKMMSDELPSRLADAPSMGKSFELLRSYPTIGDFLAYQYVTDLNYSSIINFSEMEFVVAGPGARDGIRKCFSDFGGLSEAEIIKLVTDRQETEFYRLGLDFQSLWGRPLQLIDCQNIFCEVDKYSRVKHPEYSGITGRHRIKQKYRPNLKPISYWYPPKWGLNERATKGDKSCFECSPE